MNALLAKLNLDNCTILTPAEALAQIAFRGDWTALAAAIVAKLEGSAPGSMVKLSDINLSADDFKRKTATSTRKVGEVDHQPLASALRPFGFKLVRVVDESDRGILLPSDRAERVAKVAEQRKANAAKAAAKAKAAKAAKAAK
jgi:hypothetical protein